MNTNEIKNTNTTNTNENAAVQESTAAETNMTNMTSDTLYSEIPPISVEGSDANDGISVMCVGGSDGCTGGGNTTGGTTNEDSECHNPDCTCPECNCVKPAAPSISLNESTNYITWSAVDGATGYILYAYDTKNKETMTMGVYSYVSDLSYDLSGVDTDGETWLFYVVAYNDCCESEDSNIVSYSSPAPIPPAIPAAPSITVYPGIQSVMWISVTGADGYKVYVDGVLDGTTTSSSYSLASITEVGDHTVTVTAYNTSGESAHSNTATYTVNIPVPEAPVITVDANAKTVSWLAVDGATSYNIYVDGSLFATTTSISYSLAAITEAGEHTIVVVAQNSSGMSGNSNTATYTVNSDNSGGTTDPATVIYDTDLAPSVEGVNLHTGKLTYSFNDISLDGYGIPLAVSHVYAPDTTEVSDRFGLGNGWRTTLNQTLTYVESIDPDIMSGDYYYTDAQGKSYKFASNDGGPDGSGAGLTLSGSTVTDRAGNAMTFDTAGNLTELADSYGNKLTVAYSTDGKISTVTDSYGRTATFSYTSGRLVSITVTGSDSNVTDTNPVFSKTTTYSYDSDGNLATVTFSDGTVFTFTYRNTEFIVDSSIGTSMYYGYTNGKITDIHKYTNITRIADNDIDRGTDKTVNSISISYTDTYTSVLPMSGNKSFYQFLYNGNVSKVYTTSDRSCTVFGGAKGSMTAYFYENSELSKEVTYNVKNAASDNFLINGCFENNTTGWMANYGALDNYKIIENSGERYMVLPPTGDPGIHAQLLQSCRFDNYYVPGEVLCLSAKAKFATIPTDDSIFARVRVTAVSADETEQVFAIEFDKNTTEWQEKYVEMVLPYDVKWSAVLIESNAYGDEGDDTGIRFEYVSLNVASYGKSITRSDTSTVYLTETPTKAITEIYNSGYKLKKKIVSAPNFDDYVIDYDYYGEDDVNAGKLRYATDSKDVRTEYSYTTGAGYGVNGLVTAVKRYNKNTPQNYLGSSYGYDEVPMEYNSVRDENGIATLNLYGTNYNRNMELPSSVKVGNREITYTYNKTKDIVESVSAEVDGNTLTMTYGHTLGALTSVTAEDGTVYKYEYDGRGNITKISKVQNNVATTVLLEKEYYYSEDDSYIMQVITTYGAKSDLTAPYVTATYDERGNVTYVECSGETDILANYTYQNGVLTSAEKLDNDCTFVYNYKYDNFGRLDKVTRKATSDTEEKDHITYGYNGGIVSYTSYRVNDSISHSIEPKYSSDATSELFGVKVYNIALTEENKDTAEPLFETTIVKDDFGRLTNHEISTSDFNIMESYGYGDHLTGARPVSFTRLDGTVDNLVYTDDSGVSTENITEIRDVSGSTKVKYTYDSIGRLIREDNYALGKSIETTYDTSGNITRKTEYCLCEDGTTCGTLSDVNYTYGGTGKFLGVSGDEGFIVGGYDAQGNPTIYRGNSLTWERGHNLASYGGITFTYDSDGMRTRKGSVEYVNVGGKTIAEIDASGKVVKEYFYDERGICGFSYGNIMYYYIKSLFGDITDIYKYSNGALTKVAHYDYDAWGNHTIVLDTDGIGTLNPFRYRGYYYDTETGLYYLQSRYYDAQIGRFISQDNVSYLDPESFGGTNLYAYCGNNPVMYVDPSGHFAISTFLIGLAVTSLVSWGLSEVFGAQIVGGASSMANGYGAISTGLGLLSFGPLGWVAGGLLILAGVGAMIMGANEIVDDITGTNYIQEWTGWSDSVYNGLYIGVNVASSIGTIAGKIYMKYNPPYPGKNPNTIPDGFNDRVNDRANYYNPKTGQSLHPDLNHPKPIGPHWDWKDSNGQWWRLYRFWRIKK